MTLSRLFDPAEKAQEDGQEGAVTNGTNEWQMRSQMRAWVRFMTAGMREGAAA